MAYLSTVPLDPSHGIRPTPIYGIPCMRNKTWYPDDDKPLLTDEILATLPESVLEDYTAGAWQKFSDLPWVNAIFFLCDMDDAGYKVPIELFEKYNEGWIRHEQTKHGCDHTWDDYEEPEEDLCIGDDRDQEVVFETRGITIYDFIDREDEFNDTALPDERSHLLSVGVPEKIARVLLYVALYIENCFPVNNDEEVYEFDPGHKLFTRTTQNGQFIYTAYVGGITIVTWRTNNRLRIRWKHYEDRSTWQNLYHKARKKKKNSWSADECIKSKMKIGTNEEAFMRALSIIARASKKVEKHKPN